MRTTQRSLPLQKVDEVLLSSSLCLRRRNDLELLVVGVGDRQAGDTAVRVAVPSNTTSEEQRDCPSGDMKCGGMYAS